LLLVQDLIMEKTTEIQCNDSEQLQYDLEALKSLKIELEAETQQFKFLASVHDFTKNKE